MELPRRRGGGARALVTAIGSLLNPINAGKIEASGGTVVFFDNPESFASVMQFMRYMGNAAVGGGWGERVQMKGSVQ